jgi:hypothetical protein
MAEIEIYQPFMEVTVSNAERSLLEQVVSEVQYFTMAWCAAIDRT